MLRLVRYCLVNPFQRAAVEGVTISSVLNWLTEILPDPSVVRAVMVDTEQLEHLELSLVTSISEKIRKDLHEILASVPKMVQPDLAGLLDFARNVLGMTNPEELLAEKGRVFGKNAMAANFWSGRLNQFKPLVMPESQRAIKLDNPNLGAVAHSPVAWAYFNYCVFLHNRSLVSQVDELLVSLDDKVKRLPPRDKAGVPVCPVDEVMETSLPYWVELWIKTRQLPKALQINTRESVKALLEYPTFRNQHVELMKNKNSLPKPEAIYGPMQEVAKLLAYHLGVVIPGLPFFNDGRRGRSWFRSLRDSLKVYNKYAKTSMALELGWKLSNEYERSVHWPLAAYLRDLDRDRELESGPAGTQREHPMD
jgi:hypothetical protein